MCVCVCVCVCVCECGCVWVFCVEEYILCRLEMFEDPADVCVCVSMCVCVCVLCKFCCAYVFV